MSRSAWLKRLDIALGHLHELRIARDPGRRGGGPWPDRAVDAGARIPLGEWRRTSSFMTSTSRARVGFARLDRCWLRQEVGDDAGRRGGHERFGHLGADRALHAVGRVHVHRRAVASTRSGPLQAGRATVERCSARAAASGNLPRSGRPRTVLPATEAGEALAHIGGVADLALLAVVARCPRPRRPAAATISLVALRTRPRRRRRIGQRRRHHGLEHREQIPRPRQAARMSGEDALRAPFQTLTSLEGRTTSSLDGRVPLLRPLLDTYTVESAVKRALPPARP